MMDDFNFEAVCAFAIFADRLNFTHAADDLHISQPALFVKIQDLARIVGVPLYTKVGRQLQLTEAGRQLARFGRELRERKAAVLSELRGQKDEQPVILAAGEGAFLYLLGPAITAFKSITDQPLSLLTLNREGVIDAIQSGRAHLGVAAFDSIPSQCQSALLCKVDQVLVMPDGNKIARKRVVSLSDLDGASLVVPSADRPHRQLISAHLQSAGISWRVAVEANGWQLMLHFVKLGLGYAIVNSNCAIPEGLIAKKLTGLPQIHYSLIWRAGGVTSLAQRQLRECLLQNA
jgi:DNA-binding transcriptional LysR family regulator